MTLTIVDTEKKRMIMEVMHFCMFANPKTQEMTWEQLKQILVQLFEPSEIDQALDALQEERVTVDEHSGPHCPHDRFFAGKEAKDSH